MRARTFIQNLVGAADMPLPWNATADFQEGETRNGKYAERTALARSMHMEITSWTDPHVACCTNGGRPSTSTVYN